MGVAILVVTMYPYRLNAADVMNPNLKYIYPVSRVSSIERLLRVTAHNAFLVVTPLNIEPQENIDSQHTPQLYERLSIHPMHKKKLLEERKQRKKRQEKAINRSDAGASNVVTFQSAEDNSQDVALVFHGMILRSQLVELLRNSIFFDENQGVS